MSDEIKENNKWLEDLYDINKFTVDQLNEFYNLYQYQGFNRNEVLKQLRKLVPDTNEAVQIIIVCALRGPQQAAITTLKSGRTIQSYKIPASGQQGTKGISCQRITSATADLAAFYLKIMNAPKRIEVECPSWLQFPAAGAIKLPQNIRLQHIEFSRKFSELIGGAFSEQIYNQMMLNSYLDDKIEQFLFPIDSSSTITASSQPSSSSSSSSATPTTIKKPKV